jgi:Outer membrane protein beta-barrel domain
MGVHEVRGQTCMEDTMRSLRFALFGLVAALVMKATPASADALVEPYLGYKMGTFDNNGAKGDLTGVALGARVGFAFPVVFIAADYSVLTGGSIDWDAAASGETDITGSDLYATVGVSLPLIRAYAGYGVMNKLKPDGSAEIKDGTHIKLGVGTTILPFVAINLDYQTSDWDKQGDTKIDGVKSNVFMLSASVPFEF